jgi:hypothetical protein
LWCRWNGNHSKDDLARFGYKLDMKVERKPDSFYILGYLLELMIKMWNLDYFFLRKMANFVLNVSMKIPLYWSKSYFSGRNFGEISPKENIASHQTWVSESVPGVGWVR